MADSWTSIDGVTLDWTTRPFKPELYRYYTKAIFLAVAERCYLTSGYTFGTGWTAKANSVEMNNIWNMLKVILVPSAGSTNIIQYLADRCYLNHTASPMYPWTLWGNTALLAAIGDPYWIERPDIIRMRTDENPFTYPNAYRNTYEDWLVQWYKALNLLRLPGVPGGYTKNAEYYDRRWYCNHCNINACTDFKDTDWTGTGGSGYDYRIASASTTKYCPTSCGPVLGGDRDYHSNSYVAFNCDDPTFPTIADVELYFEVDPSNNLDMTGITTDGLTAGLNMISFSTTLAVGEIEVPGMADLGKIDDMPSWNPWPHGCPPPEIGDCCGISATETWCAAHVPSCTWESYSPKRYEQPTGWTASWGVVGGVGGASIIRPRSYQFKDW